MAIHWSPFRSLALTTVLLLLSLVRAEAQEFIQLSDKYTCARFASGGSTILLNGPEPGQYSIIGAGPALKDLRAEKRALNEKVRRLNETRKAVERGEFTKKASGFVQQLIDHYLPSEKVKQKRRERVAQINLLIQKVRADIALLKAVDLAISQCADPKESDKSVAKYGQRIPVVVKPVIVPASASFNYREAYVGMLISVPQDVPINDRKGRKLGTRSGYLACAKNLNTGATFYRIFDDQPCQESEGGPSGGNTSLPFADLAACKALVPANSWASFGYWQAVGSYPSADHINSAFANLLATFPPFFQVVFYDADPYPSGVSLDEFKSWCSSGRAF